MFLPLLMNFTWNNQDTSKQTTTQKAAKIENGWTKRLGKKREAIWVKRKNGWKDIERKEVKRRNTSFGWKKLGRLHVNGLLMAYWSPLFWVLTPDFTFHKKIGSGNRDDMFNHWNQKPHFGGVTSEDPQNNFGFREMAKIAMDTFWGARCSSDSLAFWVWSFFVAYFNSLNQSTRHPMILSIWMRSNSARTARYSKTIGWFGLSTKWFGDSAGHFTANHPNPKRRAGGIAGRLCRPLPHHSDECTWTHPES